MNGYEIIKYKKIEKHITFIRINPTNVELTLNDIFTSISDLSWLSSFDEDYIRDGFKVRAEDTIKYIHRNILRGNEDSITSESGEIVVSELARKTVVNHIGYLDIPLAELIKIKDIGNHGYDFYSINDNHVLLFGEAKYNARQNAYGKSFEQLVRFEAIKQDRSDIIDIDRFCCDESKRNHSKGIKGFIAAFSAKTTPTKKIINGIKRNRDYQSLKDFEEIICVAVNL